MNDIKVSLTIMLQGGTMWSRQECLKDLKEPVLISKGKYAGKPKRDKKGNIIYTTKRVVDETKVDHHEVRLTDKDGKLSEILHYHTRGAKPAKQVLPISQVAYDYFISSEVPDGYNFPRDFKPNKKLLKQGISVSSQAWNSQTPKQKLEWHLRRICATLNGTLGEYHIFND